VAVGDRSGHGYASYLVFGPPFRLSRGAGRTHPWRPASQADAAEQHRLKGIYADLRGSPNRRCFVP
jgi:hypothetical protein